MLSLTSSFGAKGQGLYAVVCELAPEGQVFCKDYDFLAQKHGQDAAKGILVDHKQRQNGQREAQSDLVCHCRLLPPDGASLAKATL